MKLTRSLGMPMFTTLTLVVVTLLAVVGRFGITRGIVGICIMRVGGAEYCY